MAVFNQFILIFSWIGFCSTGFPSLDIRCFDGPDFWCLNDTTESICNFTNKQIGLCGYSNKRCEITTGDDFCKSSVPQSPFQFNGGLTGVDENLFFYYILSLYWPPSSCPPVYNETLDFLRYFCSPYTDVDQPGSERLVLHGLWPTFSTKGNYQGWPQFCSSNENDWSKCHIDGNLCPWKNATKEGFGQTDYEYCLSVENIDRCLINPSDVLQPEIERLKVLAPGYLARRNLFINHEWTKHVETFTGPESLTYEYIQRYAGEKIGLAYLIKALNYTAIINCNSKCELEEVWMCMNRNDETGLPTQSIPCPLGARNASDSCRKARCEYVLIPLRTRSEQIPSYWINFIAFIFLLFLLKIFLLVSRSKNLKK